jgi:CRP-like cAMP-binding protein
MPTQIKETCVFYANLTAEERAAVDRAGRILTFSTGEHIVREGDKDRALLILQQGHAEVRKELARKSYKHLKELKAGELFGEIAFLGVTTRSASVVALDNCTVLELTPEKLEALAKRNPEIGMKLYRNLARDLAQKLKNNTDDLREALLWATQGMEM